jgi:hypothetical protein
MIPNTEAQEEQRQTQRRQEFRNSDHRRCLLLFSLPLEAFYLLVELSPGGLLEQRRWQLGIL